MTRNDAVNRLAASVSRPDQLDADARAEMLALYRAHYCGVDARVFVDDLAAKTHVILLHDGVGAVRGFSTIRVWELPTPAGRVTVMYSGDTIIDRSHWGSQLLPLAWVELAGEIKAQNPGLPLYWLLISKGHRTYRLLPAFANRFYPTWRDQTPRNMAALMRYLGEEMFGERFDAAAGIVRHEPGGAALSPEFSGDAARAANHREIAFFNRLNPDHASGDELLCLCELSADNLRPMARARFQDGYERARLGAAA